MRTRPRAHAPVARAPATTRSRPARACPGPAAVVLVARAPATTRSRPARACPDPAARVAIRPPPLSEQVRPPAPTVPVSYTHLRAHETRHDLVCRLLLEK